ncbi:MAG TPA: porin [Hydrogenophaga sp.]|nr:porin [Hydrogenophaga sp.]
MKKSLIALAVLGVAGVAQAQSSVTLYGIADVGIIKNKGSAATMDSGLLSGSRLGFKGTEDLGGGLRAVFLLEAGLSLDTGGPEKFSFNRQSYVGLGGGFGEIRFGKIWTAYDDIAWNVNPVFDSAFSPAVVRPSLGFVGNPNNGIKYVSPDFGGVSGAISTSMREGGSTRSTAFQVKYEGGPIYAGFAHQIDKDGVEETKFTTLNGTYDFGAVKLLAGYGRTAIESAKSTDLSIGADVPVGAVTLSAGFVQTKIDGLSERLRSFGLGATYDLSKRTVLYAGARKVNDTASDLGVAAETTYGLGIKHSF